MENDQRYWLKDLPIRSEEIGFTPEQMIACSKCSKANPPNRFKCLYCGTTLEISAEKVADVNLNLRPLEKWERGFNVIVIPGGDDEGIAETLFRIAGLNEEAFADLVKAGRPFPVARVESEREAEIVRDKIVRAGFAANVISDEKLAADNPPRRLRNVEFQGGKATFTLFNSGEKITLEKNDLALIVSGSIFESKTETTEKRKKREMHTTGETQTSKDETVLDIYSTADPIGWRIRERGFDFSCLGEKKGLIAVENIQRLIAVFGAFAPDAVIDREFSKISDTLGAIWEVEETIDSSCLQRSMFKSGDRTRIRSSSNLSQFTKYSRMLRHLL